MDQLRWILLAIGALVLLGLALFEARRRQHAAEQPDPLIVRQEPVLDPDLSLDLSDSRDSDLSRRDPPLVMIDDMGDVAEGMGFEVAGEVAVDRPGRPESAAVSWTDEDDAGAPVQWPPLPLRGALTRWAKGWHDQRVHARYQATPTATPTKDAQP